MMRAIVIATSMLLMFDVASAQVRPPAAPTGSNLAAASTRQTITPLPCNSVSACNVLIAKCVEREGTWVQHGESPIGQPSSGICYFR